MVFANGYTMAEAWNLDGLGHIYIALTLTWTAILLIGIIFLVAHRSLPFIRIRNVPLCVSAVLILHVYWSLCLIAYILQAFFPCTTEFWIMSIYLPLGIALYHAANTQLLHIAELQKQFTDVDSLTSAKSHQLRKIRGWRRYVAFVYARNQVKKTMGYISYAIFIQFCIAMLIFLISRKFHPGFGVVGPADSENICPALEHKFHTTDCDAAKKTECRRGWEWILSILWQFFWSWVYAPYLLWKLRDIKDVHGWRKQTFVCCIAGLPASPMWLIALYVPQMWKVNLYWVPPMWFAPSIFLIEAFLVFVPCWQILKNRRLKRETLDIIANWENKNNGSSITSETTYVTNNSSQKSSSATTICSRRGEMYTMTALESALRTNPQPLLLFAALKDFSGENISFLTSLLEWKRGWSPLLPPRNGFLSRPSPTECDYRSIQRQQFKKAVDIYASFVSLKYSNFPVNLSYGHYKKLEEVFQDAASTIHSNTYNEIDAATPFNLYEASARSSEADSPTSKDGVSIASTAIGSTDNVLPIHNKGSKHQRIVETFKMTHLGDKLPEDAPIPANFGAGIFDHAEESIKYMVLTNTWPKFVNAGYANVKKKTFLEIIEAALFDRHG